MFQKFSEVLEAIRKKRYRNEGSSLIMVIIMISFVGVLVSVSVYASYYNFFMKYSDRSAKDNFYTVESALEEINMGLQREISDAMAESYMAANKRSDFTVQQKEDEFKKGLYNALWEKIRYTTPGSTSNTGQYRVDKLTLYLDKTRYNTDTKIGAIVLTKQNATDPEFFPGLMTRESGLEVVFNPSTTSDLLILKNLSLQYTDPRGYVSMLTTDIVVTLPKVSFVSGKEMPDIENYCLIAHKRLETEPSATANVDGSVYGGGTEGMFSLNHSALRFNGTTRQNKVITKRVVAETGDIDGSSVTTINGNSLWTEAIDVTSANISLEDNTYVKDDLTVEGRNSKITLKGKYYGYGNGSVQAEDSSSIVLNGAGTTLDMSGLTNLTLMGHAFIGARHYDVNAAGSSDYVEDINSIPAPGTNQYENNSDFLLGQSVGVKSDQAVYKVPEECMGYEGNVQVLPKNPMTLAEHTMLTTTVATDASGNPIKDAMGRDVLRYTVVRLDKVFEKLGKTPNSYGASYRPVFRRVNGSIIVTYYLYFNSESMANQFFYDYYTADKEAVDAYMKDYINDFVWNDRLGEEAASPLHIAGNLVYFDRDGNAVLKKDTKAEDLNNMAELSQSMDLIIDSYSALYAKLTLNIGNVAASELTDASGNLRTAYQNIVKDDTEFTNVVPRGSLMECNNRTAGVDEADVVRAVVVNNSDASGNSLFTFEIGDAPAAGGSQYTTADKLYFVVASGDVRVTAHNFNGVILSGGKITVSSGVHNFVSSPDKVKKAMGCRDISDPNFPTEGKQAVDVLVDGALYLSYSSAGNNEELPANEYGFIELNDLIHYENWNKK